MCLVNGAEGIGSGWSTSVPNFDPREITQALISKLKDDQDFTDLKPHFKGYRGEITIKSDNNYEIKGMIEFD